MTEQPKCINSLGAYGTGSLILKLSPHTNENSKGFRTASNRKLGGTWERGYATGTVQCSAKGFYHAPYTTGQLVAIIERPGYEARQLEVQKGLLLDCSTINIG